ncbi:hypothetical protein Tco_0487926 [Tanacetum coccineum]
MTTPLPSPISLSPPSARSDLASLPHYTPPLHHTHHHYNTTTCGHVGIDIPESEAASRRCCICATLVPDTRVGRVSTTRPYRGQGMIWVCLAQRAVPEIALIDRERVNIGADQMVETLRVIRDMRREMSDMQAELLALREQQRRARQPG